MSTNSMVGFVRKDGSVVASYVHYDGYETGVGETLLENYNSSELAEEVASAGYFSSLSGDMKESLSNSVHTEEIDEFRDFNEYRDFAVENSHLEFVYLWLDNRWIYASWTLKVEGVGRYAEYNSTWNGFHELIPAYVREARKMIVRFRDIALEDNRDVAEYDTMADVKEKIVNKWHRIGMKQVAEEALAA